MLTVSDETQMQSQTCSKHRHESVALGQKSRSQPLILEITDKHATLRKL